MMTTMVVYALRSRIHSLQVAVFIMNSGRDVIVLTVAEVKSTTIMVMMVMIMMNLYYL